MAEAAGDGNVLLLLIGDPEPEALRTQLADLGRTARHVHVVAPMLVGPLDWLATAEDEAHDRAELRAFDAEWTLADTAEVEGEAGAADPVQAVEDALRGFPADEIVIAGVPADPDLERALSRHGLPVRRLQPPSAQRSILFRGLRGLAHGRGTATPFVLFVGVNAALLLLGILLSLLVLLVLWLLGDL